ncbi:ATP-dependent nuclease, partial [Helicobacter typhlonius]
AIDNIIKELQQEKEKHNELIEKLETLKEFYHNECDWRNPISEYIMRVWIKPNLPKFLYYDEYYSLPSRVSIQKLQQERLEAEELKTAQALFELANIDIETLIKSNDFEDFQAELEATESAITDELFKFWDTNKNLQIEFKIDKVSDSANRQILEHILDIRVKNTDKRVSLPLNKRSKGFNWFFSFLVWFKKIQEDKNAQYILLLDEPGLNLHAMAQENLLNFLEELSKQYQIIYTTHSPFMIDSSHLERVRTIFETKEGSKISDSLQEKDPNTLFPLQAALGYNIAQNLFISKNNLIVEGISDLTYLTYMSSLLQENGKEGLSDDITIIPVGGADKVSAFISLMRGNKLKIVCLLDTFTEQKPKAHIDKLINEEKILKLSQVIFYDKFTEIDVANIEDIFTTEEYLKLFNEAFSEYDNINVEDIDKSKTILDEISKIIGKPRFNHYIPAKLLVSKALKIKDFGDTTINRFEKIFAEVNRFLQK